MSNLKFFLLFMLMLLCSNIGCAYHFQVDGIYYNILATDNSHEVEVSFKSSNSYSGVVTIPADVRYNGISYKVTSIGYRAFNCCFDLTQVNIPNSVMSIGDYAFSSCNRLTEVSIPNSVLSIGEGAFYSCSKMKYVTLPDSVIQIGNSAFYACKNLVDITIPASVVSLGDYAFAHCQSLTEITIPSSVKSIGEAAFIGCTALEAFFGPYASSDHRCIIDQGVLRAVAPAGLTSYDIPFSVTSIGHDAFFYCYALEQVTIPGSVTSIGEGAFMDCKKLTQVTIPSSVSSIGNGAFSLCKGLKAFWGKYASDDQRCLIDEQGVLIAFAPAGLTSYVIPSTVTSIGYSAFSGYTNLMDVTIPNSVTSIAADAFGGCWGLTNVKIPNSVLTIGESAYAFCNGLKSVIIPNSVTSIGERAFYSCESLTTIDLPTSITSIGIYAFCECKLSSVWVHWKNPDNVSVFSESFTYNIIHENCILYVPTGTIDKYKDLYPWRNFKEIHEYAYEDNEDSGIESIEAEKTVLIKTGGGNIKICGTDFDEIILLYDINGMLLDTVKAADGETNIQYNLQRGQTYIVRYGDKTIKYKF